MASAAPAASAAPEQAFLSVNNIEVVYSHVILVLKGVSLSVPKGGIVALLGANGAGKTTTLKAISNLLHAERGEVTKGSIQFDGEEVHSRSPNELVQRGCIQVMEGRRCFAHLTVEENLMVGLQGGREGASRTDSFDQIYATFPVLGERRRQRSGTLSGGERQMLAIAAAMIRRPRFLLLDEPTSGLAPIVVDMLIDRMLRFVEIGTTLLIAHRLSTIRHANRIAVVDEGQIAEEGTHEELLARGGLYAQLHAIQFGLPEVVAVGGRS